MDRCDAHGGLVRAKNYRTCAAVLQAVYAHLPALHPVLSRLEAVPGV